MAEVGRSTRRALYTNDEVGDAGADRTWSKENTMTMQLDNGLQANFREVMAGVATPVSVVTSVSNGQPYGTTVSAFTSLSMDPPMVLVALNRGSRLLAAVRSSGRFGVNVLGAEQAQLALAFASKGGSAKFNGVAWSQDHELPRLDGSPGWLVCMLAELVDGGDHLIALGVVMAAETAEGQPLTYHRRNFGTHALLDD